MLSLSARGMTHGDISAHLADVYGSDVSKTTISMITDKVLEGMAEWQNLPLAPGRFLTNVANPDQEESRCRVTRRTRCQVRSSAASSS